MSWQEDDLVDEYTTAVKNASRQAMEHVKTFSQGNTPTNMHDQLKQEADNMPWLDMSPGGFSAEYPLGFKLPGGGQMMINAGRETSKLGLGIADLLDAGNILLGTPAGLIGDKLGLQSKDLGGVRSSIADLASRELRNRQEKELMKPYEEGRDFIPNVIGTALPYVLDSVVGGAPARKIGESISDTVAAATEGIKSEGRSLLTKGADYLKQKGTAGKWLSDRLYSEHINPMAASRANKAIANASGASSILADPLWSDVPGKVLGSTIMGAVEGGLHKDNSMVGGAANSLAGASLGAAARPYLSKLPSYYTRKIEQDTIDWAKANGYNQWMPPGLKSGLKKHQMFEAGVKNSRRYGDVFTRNDRAMDQVTSYKAGKAIGIDVPKEGLTPGVMRNHLDNLSGEYEKLTKDTRVYLRQKDKDKVLDHFKSLSNDPSEQVKIALKEGKGYFDWIDKLSKPSRDPFTGRMKAVDFNGARYQEVRRSLKSTIDDAWLKGDAIKAKTLTPLLTMLDDGTKHGMIKYGSKSDVKAWKDLNQRNALTEMVLEHGYDPLAGANMRKLGQYFIGSDGKRLATFEGPARLKELQKISLFELMRQRQAGGSLTGLGVSHDFGAGGGSSNQTLMQYLAQTPVAELIAPPVRAGLAAYMKGYPSLSGYLGLSRNNFGDTIAMTRSAYQGIKPQETILKFLAGDDQNRVTPVMPFISLKDEQLKRLENQK